jgi:multiple sugar transport system substrate-binding protein
MMRQSVNRVAWLGLVALTLALGCQPASDDGPQSASSTQPVDQTPQKILLVSLDDSHKVADRIAQVWTAQTAGEVEVVHASASEVFASEPAGLPPCDVVLYPNFLIGELLVRNSIQPIDVARFRDMGIDRQALLRHDRVSVVQSGKSVFGASLGTPLLMLLVRQDVLDQLKLAPPKTWDQYLAVRQALAGAGEIKSPQGKPLPTMVCEPAQGAWLPQMLLARSAPAFVRQGRLSSYFDVESMDALVNSPPFVKALEQMVAEHALAASQPLTPEECFAAMIRGEAAMAIAWPTSQSPIEAPAGNLPIGVYRLPGSIQSYDYRDRVWSESIDGQPQFATLVPVAGRVASIAAGTRRLRSAERLVAWLMSADANREISTQFGDTLLTQSSALMSPYPWISEQLPRDAAQQVADELRVGHEQSLPLYNLRIPGRDEYLKELADAIEKALTGKMSPPEALDAAATRWNEITDRLGRERQRDLFRDSVRMQF